MTAVRSYVERTRWVERAQRREVVGLAAGGTARLLWYPGSPSRGEHAKVCVAGRHEWVDVDQLVELDGDQ